MIHVRSRSDQSIFKANGRPRKKIVDCYASMEFGGLARHMVVEVNGLNARGHDIYLVLQDKRGELLPEVSCEVPVFGLGYHGPYSYTRMLWNLVRVVRQIKPDVILSHAWPVDMLVFIASRFIWPRPRIVLFNHTLVELIDLAETSEIRFRMRLLKSIIRYIYKRVDSITAVSPRSKEGIIKQFGTLAQCIQVIPSLWDMDKVLLGAREQLDDPWFRDEYNRIPVVLSCGPLTPAKDFPMLLRAFALVRKRCLARLAIIGDGPLRSTLLRLAEDLGIESDFRIFGYQSNPANYMAHADVFALPSVVEGFGTVLVEALLLGVPVVATNVGGPEFVLDHGQYGLLVQPKVPQSMADAILRLLNDDLLWARLNKMGPERARFFAPDKTLDRIEKILLGLENQGESQSIGYV